MYILLFKSDYFFKKSYSFIRDKTVVIRISDHIIKGYISMKIKFPFSNSYKSIGNRFLKTLILIILFK